MSGFSFGGLNVAATKKALQAEMIDNPVLIDKSSNKGTPYYLVLLDEWYPPSKLKKIETFMRLNGFNNYRAVTSINVKMKKDEMKGELSKFYRTNQSRWKKYADGARAVITVGAALYAVNQSADLLVDHFRDVIFNKSFYWSPDCNAYVFPIDSFHDIFIPVASEKKDMFAPSAGGPANTFRTRFAEYQFQQAQTTRLVPPRNEDPRLHMVESEEEFIDICQHHFGAPKMSWDLETSGFDFMICQIGCITMSFNGVDGYYTPWELVNKKVLNELFGSVGMQIGANLKFDVRFLWREGITNAYIHNDTVQLGHMMNEQRFNGLKAHAFLYTRFGGYDRELDRYVEKTGINNYLDIPTPIMFEYATMDAIVTWLVHEALQKQLSWVDETYPNEKLSDWNMRRYYEEVMMPAVNAFAEIEYRGVYTDAEKLAESRSYVISEIEKIEEELRGIWKTPQDFDFNSPTKLGVLFEELGWEDIGRNKREIYQTSDAHLTRWKKLGHEGVSQFQKLRSLKTLLKTFLSPSADADKGWAQYLRDHNEDESVRMHPTFNVMRTESGRCKSSNPNMQNVPSHGEFAKLVKKAITTPDPRQFYLSTVDYASLQIRLAAIDTNLNESGRDENLYNVYIDPKMGGDMHSRTGYGVFADGRDFELDIIEVEDEAGNAHTFFGDEMISTTNRGEIYAKDLTPEDSLAI